MRLVHTVRSIVRLVPWAAGAVLADPEDDLSIRLLNEQSRPALSQSALRTWAFEGAPAVVPERRAGACCTHTAFSSREDSLSRIGVVIEASRPFTTDIRIYSNLGQFVDRIAFTIPSSQFEQLPPGSRPKTRSLRVLWDNRTATGAPAGTGAYVLKTRVTLKPLAGETNAGTLTRIDYRIVALLRNR